jgi:hypothetical protein
MALSQGLSGLDPGDAERKTGGSIDAPLFRNAV